MTDPKHTPPVTIEFSAKWFHTRFGLDFGEKSWRDPILRTEQDCQMRRLLHEAYGELGIGEADPKPRPNVEAYGPRERVTDFAVIDAGPEVTDEAVAALVTAT